MSTHILYLETDFGTIYKIPEGFCYHCKGKINGKTLWAQPEGCYMRFPVCKSCAIKWYNFQECKACTKALDLETGRDEYKVGWCCECNEMHCKKCLKSFKDTDLSEDDEEDEDLICNACS